MPQRDLAAPTPILPVLVAEATICDWHWSAPGWIYTRLLGRRAAELEVPGWVSTPRKGLYMVWDRPTIARSPSRISSGSVTGTAFPRARRMMDTVLADRAGRHSAFGALPGWFCVAVAAFEVDPGRR